MTTSQSILSSLNAQPESVIKEVLIELLRRFSPAPATEEVIAALQQPAVEGPDYEDAGPITGEEIDFIAAQAFLRIDEEEAALASSTSITVSPSGGTQLLLTAVVTPEDDMFVSQCLEIDVASQGDTVEESLVNLREAVELLLEPPYAATIPELHRFEVEVSAT